MLNLEWQTAMAELSLSPVRILLTGKDYSYNTVRTLLSDDAVQKYELEWAPTIGSFLQIRKKKTHDVYLFDQPVYSEILQLLTSEIIVDDCCIPCVILADKEDELESGCSALGSFPAKSIAQGQLNGPYLKQSIISAIERSKMTLALSRANRYWLKIFDGIPDVISIIDRDYLIQRTNKTMALKLGMPLENLIGKRCYELVHNASEPPEFCPLSKLLKDGQEHSAKVYEQNLGGHYMVSVSPLIDDDMRLIGAIHVARDISPLIIAEEALQEINKNLEQLAADRTLELVEKTKNLEELNTVLKVLLQHREQDLMQLHDSIALGIKTNILPYLNRIMQSNPTQRQIESVTMIQNGLGKILSHHVPSALTDRSIGLSPAEIRVAEMVKDGMSNKETADALFISEGTVRTHREHLRKKLGLNNKKINLRTHRLSLR
jgi:PAS domain S-box-containing protein